MVANEKPSAGHLGPMHSTCMNALCAIVGQDMGLCEIEFGGSFGALWERGGTLFWQCRLDAGSCELHNLHNATKSQKIRQRTDREKKRFPRKLRKTVPDSVVTFFSIPGSWLLWGPERALRG